MNFFVQKIKYLQGAEACSLRYPGITCIFSTWLSRSHTLVVGLNSLLYHKLKYVTILHIIKNDIIVQKLYLALTMCEY